MDNISAISTAIGTGGVAIIRLSGDSVLSVASKMFLPNGSTQVNNFEPNKMYTGEILANGFKDYGMCVYFKAPKSFTGEDVVEFHCHGGLSIARGILKKTFELGCKSAQKGEFTRRAFLNGKLSLSSAEGMIDMINGESESEVKAGYYLYTEKLNRIVGEIQSELTNILASVDADIDFPEEDIERDELSNVKSRVIAQRDKIEGIISRYNTGRKIKEGVTVALTGRTNTGKSSILNALLGYDKAIVSNIAGTTRDAVEGGLVLEGIKFNVYDTAGIRESDDFVENIGISRAEKIVESADLVLFVLDASNPLTSEDKELYQKVKDKNTIVIFNKSDLSKIQTEIEADISVSALTLENIDLLKEMMVSKSIDRGSFDGEFLTEERHYYALKKASDCLKSGIDNCGLVPLDLIAIDLKNAWDTLGEISGQTASEDIINEIFSKFCVGK